MRRLEPAETECLPAGRGGIPAPPGEAVTFVIKLRRLDDSEFMVNAFLIETVEATPDTVVTLTTGRKFVVREPVAAVLSEALDFYRAVLGGGRIIAPTIKEGENG